MCDIMEACTTTYTPTRMGSTMYKGQYLPSWAVVSGPIPRTSCAARVYLCLVRSAQLARNVCVPVRHRHVNMYVSPWWDEPDSSKLLGIVACKRARHPSIMKGISV